MTLQVFNAILQCKLFLTFHIWDCRLCKDTILEIHQFYRNSGVYRHIISLGLLTSGTLHRCISLVRPMHRCNLVLRRRMHFCPRMHHSRIVIPISSNLPIETINFSISIFNNETFHTYCNLPQYSRNFSEILRRILDPRPSDPCSLESRYKFDLSECILQCCIGNHCKLPRSIASSHLIQHSTLIRISCLKFLYVIRTYP